MNLLIRPAIRTIALAACCLFMLGGCGDKHEPVKPTVVVPGAVISF